MQRNGRSRCCARAGFFGFGPIAMTTACAYRMLRRTTRFRRGRRASVLTADWHRRRRCSGRGRRGPVGGHRGKRGFGCGRRGLLPSARRHRGRRRRFGWGRWGPAGRHWGRWWPAGRHWGRWWPAGRHRGRRRFGCFPHGPGRGGLCRSGPDWHRGRRRFGWAPWALRGSADRQRRRRRFEWGRRRLLGPTDRHGGRRRLWRSRRGFGRRRRQLRWGPGWGRREMLRPVRCGRRLAVGRRGTIGRTR